MNTKTVVIVLVVLAVIIGGYLMYNTGPMVSAQGTSSIKVQPDLVSVMLSVETRNLSADDAQRENEAKYNVLVSELKRQGIEDEDIQLSNYGVYQEYDWSDGKRKELGFVARREVYVKSENFTDTAKIVSAAIESNTLVSYINFEISMERQNEYKAQALEEASKDARRKADSIAKGQGKSVGKLVSLNNQEYNYGGPVMYYSAASEKAADANIAAQRAATGISPREGEISASVSAQYTLRGF